MGLAGVELGLRGVTETWGVVGEGVGLGWPIKKLTAAQDPKPVSKTKPVPTAVTARGSSQNELS